MDPSHPEYVLYSLMAVLELSMNEKENKNMEEKCAESSPKKLQTKN